MTISFAICRSQRHSRHSSSVCCVRLTRSLWRAEGRKLKRPPCEIWAADCVLRISACVPGEQNRTLSQFPLTISLKLDCEIDNMSDTLTGCHNMSGHSYWLSRDCGEILSARGLAAGDCISISTGLASSAFESSNSIAIF